MEIYIKKLKIRIDENKLIPEQKLCKIIIYDFGYCWKIPSKTFKNIGTIFIDTFEIK